MADDDAPEQPDEKPSEKPPKAEKADTLPHYLPPDSDSPPAPSGPGLWEKIKAHPTWIAIGIAALGLIVTYLIWQQQTANAGTVTAVPATATDTTGTAATGSTDYNTDPAVLAELAQLEADITALENGGSSGTVTPPPPVTPPTTPPGTMPGQPIGPTGPAQQPPGAPPPGPSPIHPVPAQKPAMIKAASLPIQNRLRTE